MSHLYRSLFWGMSKAGRRFGGLRPRWMTHWVGERAFAGGPYESDYRWSHDKWGSRLRLNPYYYMDRKIIAFGQFEEHVQRCIAERVQPGMTCFDVGANIGVMALHMARRVGAKGRVYAFEPAPLLAPCLEANVAGNGFEQIVDVQRVALTDRAGTVEMAVAPRSVANQGMGSLVNRSCEQLSERYQVPAMTIDAFAAEKGIKQVDLVKIDIQGAEPLLLAGGEHIFGTIGPDLLMEISPMDLADLGRSAKDVLTQLESYGYAVYELDPMGRPGTRRRAADAKDSDFLGNDDVICTKSAI